MKDLQRKITGLTNTSSYLLCYYKQEKEEESSY